MDARPAEQETALRTNRRSYRAEDAYGEFPPGSQLPSERKLAEQLGVNRSTKLLDESIRNGEFAEALRHLTG